MLRILFSHPAHFLALGCGSGLAPRAPGTFGTLFAWASFQALNEWFNAPQLWIFFAITFVLGIWAIGITGKTLGEIDHGSIVWDEIVPFWILLAITPDDFWWQCASFLLFRLFDITKPFPASYFDQQIKNGFGVMMDDVVAAGFAALVIGVAHLVIQ
jgi:phosphatidylglycerophosphatase A